MVQLNKMVGGDKMLLHNLAPKFEHSLFPEHGMICYIQKMSCGRFAVFPYAIKKEQTFYKVYNTLEDLNDSFEEIPI